MRNKLTIAVIAGIMIGVLLSSVVVVLAGSTNPPSGPTDSTSQMYTLEDLWYRLMAGVTSSKMGAFTEPSSGPGTGTMYTLDTIMDMAPQLDSLGAGVADVANGKRFWGLAWGAWGPRTGTRRGGCVCSGTLVGTRWCDNGNGTVTDLLGTNGKGQCLVWLKKADWGGMKLWKDPTTGHDDAHTRAGILNAGTADANLTDGSVEGDWRLPTLSELQALTTGTELIDESYVGAFTGVQMDLYWTSTSYATTPSHAWCVFLWTGNVYHAAKSTMTYYVWPVRGGQ